MFKSGYLYQIYSYPRSQEKDHDPLSRDATGMLLHPSAGADVYESGVIQGHEVRFATADLAASIQAIRERLLSLVSENGTASHCPASAGALSCRRLYPRKAWVGAVGPGRGAQVARPGPDPSPAGPGARAGRNRTRVARRRRGRPRAIARGARPRTDRSHVRNDRV